MAIDKNDPKFAEFREVLRGEMEDFLKEREQKQKEEEEKKKNEKPKSFLESLGFSI